MRLVLLAAVGTAIAASSATWAADDRVFEIRDVITSGKIEPDGSVWFTTWSEGARFVVENEKGRSERTWELLVASNEENRSINVRFDAGEAKLHPETSTIDYPVCSIALDDVVITAIANCGMGVKQKAGSEAGHNLALGWAEAEGGSARTAKRLLDRSLDSGQLPEKFRAIALLARARANASISYDAEPGSRSADLAAVEALRDYKALAALSPENSDYVLRQGYELEALGAYDEADELYQTLATKWPEEQYQATVRRAAVARLKGNHDGSLALLNSLVEQFGPDMGMKFHYHRGWTHTKLGRFDEAIADFTEGMKSQPDYAWAFLRRGCAHASVGELKAAVSDFETGAEMLKEIPVAAERKHVAYDVEHASRTARILREKLASGDRSAVPGICDGFWGETDRARKKSQLLTRDLLYDSEANQSESAISTITRRR